MAIVVYKEKIINDIVERIELFIKNISEHFPKLNVKLNKKQIYIICEIFYDKLIKKHKMEVFYKCVETIFIYSLFESINEEIDFDFECLKLNRLLLQKYLKPNEIENILETIDKKLNEDKNKEFQKIKTFKRR